MSSATVCNCQHNTSDLKGLRAMSSRQSGQSATENARRPYVLSRYSVVIRTVIGDCWPNADAGGKRRQKLVNSGPSDTEELGCVGIGT